MDLLPKALQPLKSVALAIFRDEVRLRREEGRLRVVLQPPGALSGDGHRPSPQQQARQREQAELAAMRGALARVLDELPEGRARNRHLAFFEQALSVSGLRTLESLSFDVLERALQQFEDLVTNWSPVALACLRSKLAVAVRERRRKEGGESALSAAGGAR
jgi:hypothetical protein